MWAFLNVARFVSATPTISLIMLADLLTVFVLNLSFRERVTLSGFFIQHLFFLYSL